MTTRRRIAAEPEQWPTLRDKLKLHYHNRDFTPSIESADKWGVALFIYMLCSLGYLIVFDLIPELCKLNTYKTFKLQCLGVFIVAEVALNWYYCWTRHSAFQVDNTNKVDHDLPVTGEMALPTAGGESPKGWHQCLPCQTPAPPRSFHCKICKVCVLKRDHHCFFTASCIGFRNQRYYLVLVFYTVIGCIYGLIAMFDYLNKYLPLASSQMITYIFPVALYKWAMGHIPFYFVFLILQIYATTVLVGGAIMFFLLEVAAVFNGQTMYEAGKLIRCYRQTPAEHFRSVFGRYWLLNFIFPTPFAQEGDGMSWAVGKSLKEN